MYVSFFGDRKWALVAYGGAGCLFLALYLQVQTAVAFAHIMHTFGNLIQSPNSSMADYATTMKSLAIAHLLFFVFELAINYVTRRYTWYWREAISLDYIHRWTEKAAKLEGSSQRLADAVSNFTQLAVSIFLPIARAALSIFAFIPMLWEVSKEFNVSILGSPVPGILLWVALLFSGMGTVISWLVGRRLPKLEADVQRVEGGFRSVLEVSQWDDRAHESVAKKTNGEKISPLKTMRYSYLKLHRFLLLFDVWFSLYKQMWGFLPVFLLGLFVIAGTASYGAMMQAMSALNEANMSLSLFSSLMTTITKFKSYVNRLRELERHLSPRMPLRRGSSDGIVEFPMAR